MSYYSFSYTVSCRNSYGSFLSFLVNAESPYMARIDATPILVRWMTYTIDWTWRIVSVTYSGPEDDDLPF